MKRTEIKTLTMIIIATFFSIVATAQIPEGYYDALKGKKGAELKTAVHNIIKNAKVLDYGSGKGATWWGFYTTDNDNGYVIDRYSPEKRQFGGQGQSVSGMNIEHSFPKNWWGGTKVQAYKDLYNLMPSDSKANSTKSNYGMGIVTKATYDNGVIKVGSGSNGFKLWQPYPEWEGDFARGYMYMATCYQNYIWNGEGLNTLVQGDYPTLQKWASDLYIQWAKEDPVSELEVKRNNAVYAIQGNRNPFIDFPNLMEYIWGDSIDYAFDPTNTVTSENYKGNGTVDPNPGEPGDSDNETTIYTANYKSTDGNCTIEQGDVNVWTRDVKYGWKGTGYINGVKNEAEAYLVTPELDLTAYKSATLQFAHAVNFAANPTEVLSVEVRCEGETTTLDGFTWPNGTNWTFVEAGNIDLSEFAGKKINIAFHYTSTTNEACTWEIRDIAVTGIKGAPTAINSTSATTDSFDNTLPYTIYDISGRRVSSNAKRGVYVVKQGKHTFKVMR